MERPRAQQTEFRISVDAVRVMNLFERRDAVKIDFTGFNNNWRTPLEFKAIANNRSRNNNLVAFAASLLFLLLLS